MKIYIVEEINWDHHENVSCFSTKEKAVAFCDFKYKRSKYPDDWEHDGYSYEIVEYLIDIDEC